MKYRITKLVIVAATILSTSSSVCQGGPILDWLFPNRASRRAASNVGQVTYRVPVTAYQNNFSGFSPTTSYRTVWAPIPVTQYRPVSYVNPLSSGTQTNMMPCRTQQWQARRVPYTAYQPTSLFGGGSGWQSTAPLSAVPGAATYPTVATGYRATTHQQTSAWTPVTPSGVTSYYRSASPISDGWTVVGSGVSYAAPSAGSAGLFRYGSVPASISPAGYPDAATFSPSNGVPLPHTTSQSTWKPLSSSEERDLCANCSSSHEPTPWVPLESDEVGEQTSNASRSRVTPADRAPTLPEAEQADDPYRWKPVRAGDENGVKPERPELERQTRYIAPASDGVHRDQVRPALNHGDDPYLSRKAARAAYHRDSSTQSAPAQTVPYLKPIPDLNRDRRQRPIPSLREATDERTAQVRDAAAPQGVPIDWHLVDIDHQGGLTRTKVPSQLWKPTPTLESEPSHAEGEGGWRRVR